MQVAKKRGIIHLVTKYGFIHLHDLESGVYIYMNRISGETIFLATKYKATSRVVGVNKRGQARSISVAPLLTTRELSECSKTPITSPSSPYSTTPKDSSSLALMAQVGRRGKER
jgi:hypothetical protein